MRAVVVLALVFGLVGCSRASSTRATTPSSTIVTAPRSVSTIDWPTLRNPLLTDHTYAVKDPALVFANGRWYALVSRVGASGQWRIGIASSPDLRHWSALSTMPHDSAVEGEASPDVVRAPDGEFVVTYQSFVHDRPGMLAKLYYRTTTDFEQFSEPRPLGRELHPRRGDRMIDPALVWSPAGLLLGYKYGTDEQHFEIARSSSGSLDGPWRLIGRPDIRVFGDTVENYQFVDLQDQWTLLATSNVGDQPFFRVAGDPHTPTGWLHWSRGERLRVPQEAWNRGSGATGATYEHANCAFLVGGRSSDGYYYLVYSDSPDKTTFGVEGHAVLAIARSRDLAKWSVPHS